jgi:hypothetical protein
MMTEMEVHHKVMMSLMEAYPRKTKGYPEKREASTEKINVVVERLKVPKDAKDENAVESVEALEYRYGDRHLAVGHRQQEKKRTQGGHGSL